MTMTREEQIEQESYRWFLKDFYETNGGENPDQEDVENAFQRGAEWADQHPHWRPVEERLPGEGQVVLGVREGGTDVEMYKFIGFNESTDTFDWEWHPYYRAVVDDVTHWMPMPPPPRKEE